MARRSNTPAAKPVSAQPSLPRPAAQAAVMQAVLSQAERDRLASLPTGTLDPLP